jgi:hypothetical protein
MADRPPASPTPAPAPNPSGDRERLNGDEGASPRQRQRQSATSLIFMTFVLFMLTNRNTEEALARNVYLETLDSMHRQLSNYSAWLNGTETNFTLVRCYVHGAIRFPYLDCVSLAETTQSFPCFGPS